MVKDILNDRIIHIESQEDIESVFEKIKKNKADPLVLIIPKQAISFRSLVGLKALKEKIDNLGKKIYIVTPDIVGQSFAERAGFEIIGKEDAPDDIFLIGETAKKPLVEKKLKIADIKLESSKVHLREGHGVHPESEELIRSAQKSYQEEKHKELEELEKEKEMAFSRIFKFLSRDKGKETMVVVKEGDGFSTKIKEFFSGKIWYVFAVVGIIIVSIILAFFVLPSADITLFLRKDAAKLTIQASVSKTAVDIDYSDLELPGQIIEVEDNDSQNFSSSREIEVNDRAKGTIKIYNEYSSSNQGLVATTRFETPDGKIFRAAKSIIIPGAVIEEGKMRAGSIDVEVFADEPGDVYNIAPTRFTVPGFKGTPKFSGFYGVSQNPMAGGRIGKAKVVSSDDLAPASKKLKDDLKNKIAQSLRQKIPSGFILVDNSISFELGESIFDAVLNDRVDNFKGQINGKATAMIFKEEDFNKLINKAIETKIPPDQTVYNDEKQISYKPGILNIKIGKLPLDVNVELGLVKKFNLDELKESLLKRDQESLKQFFSLYPEIQRAEVDFWPFWVKKVPRSPSKIRIFVKANN